MESSPLTRAHNHAKLASVETKRSNPVGASEEHELAATEFAAASLSTTDQEAKRLLTLLEDHHKTLANLLKGVNTRPQSNSDAAQTAIASNVNASQDGRPLPSKTTPTSDGLMSPPRLSRTARNTAQDLSNSIAHNLAAARGIPNKQRRTTPISPLVSNEHVPGRFSHDDKISSTSKQDTPATNQAGRPSWAPPSDVGTAAINQKAKAAADAASSDAPFSQFYNAFEGLMSKISAPLAFASLPLTGYTTPEPEQTKKPASPELPRQIRPKAPKLDASVDYSQLISKAALDAVGANHNLNESYYYVAGTKTFSEAAQDHPSRPPTHRRDISNLSNDSFVDANSQILPNNLRAPLSPTTTSSSPRLPNTTATYRGKTLEEIALENDTLKSVLDKTSKQLHAFQMSAQTSSLVLAQSVRSFQHLSPITTPETSRGKSAGQQQQGQTSHAVEALLQQQKIISLEENLRRYERKVSKRDEENAKLKETLGKYREKWEGLKAGAKARREQATAAGAKDAGGGSAKDKDRDRERRKSGTAAGTGAETDGPKLAVAD